MLQKQKLKNKEQRTEKVEVVPYIQKFEQHTTKKEVVPQVKKTTKKVTKKIIQPIIKDVIKPTIFKGDEVCPVMKQGTKTAETIFQKNKNRKRDNTRN